MIYLRQFNTEIEYNSYLDSESLILPNVSWINNNRIAFNPKPYDPYNGYEYVDLGLFSGLKWAKCNIGAEKESDYGLYFQWGDVVGYRSDQIGSGEGKKYFDWSDYKYCNRSDTTLTKYNSNSSYGIVDNKTILEPSDDAATVNMGGSWRMPRYDEYRELLNNTTNTWTTVNGVYGGLLTSKINGNTLFFPASGLYSEADMIISNESFCWSSSLELFDSSYILCLSPIGSETGASGVRCCGMTIRGVIV